MVKILGTSKNILLNWEKLGRIAKAKRDRMNNYCHGTEKDLVKARE